MNITGYDPRGNVTGVFNLCNINTSKGDVGFLIGQDGTFQDVNGKLWYGSSLLSATGLNMAINGTAPAGNVTLSYFQDPSQPDLIEQIKAEGDDYVDGREISFWWQPLRTHEEMYAPTIAPQLFVTRIMRGTVKKAGGAQDRSISVEFEAWSEDRGAARRISLDTRGHERLIGRPNPSLEFMPRDDFDEQKLFD